MTKHKFDSLIIGQVALDINVDYTGDTVHEMGGAVFYSGYSAAALGHSICVLPKANRETVNLEEVFSKATNVTVIPLESPESTSINNIYLSADKERRDCRAISRIAPYQVEEIPNVDAAIYHLAGLMKGDFSNELISYVAQKARVAIDVQCMIRCANEQTGEMEFKDWPEKMEMLPLIDWLKTDAAEAEILTGLTDREAAAKQLFAWGAKEIMITHNSEVLVYDGQNIYTQPLKPRNLSGRTGRGDTCFAAYITERLTKGIPEALHIAAALVSLKMEKPGPFLGSRKDVLQYMQTYFDQ